MAETATAPKVKIMLGKDVHPSRISQIQKICRQCPTLIQAFLEMGSDRLGAAEATSCSTYLFAIAGRIFINVQIDPAIQCAVVNPNLPQGPNNIPDNIPINVVK